MLLWESTLLNYADPCRNWTFQRFERAAQKKGRNRTNEKSGTLLYIYIYIVFYSFFINAVNARH